MTVSTPSIAVFKSVSLIAANLINSFDTFSSSSPVRLNLVFTSPIATPTSSISVGISENTLSADCVNPSSSSPAAPVLVMIVSYPESTSSNAANEAAPAAPIAAVTGSSFSPTFDILSPTDLIFSPLDAIPSSASPASFAALPAFIIASLLSCN